MASFNSPPICITDHTTNSPIIPAKLNYVFSPLLSPILSPPFSHNNNKDNLIIPNMTNCLTTDNNKSLSSPQISQKKNSLEENDEIPMLSYNNFNDFNVESNEDSETYMNSIESSNMLQTMQKLKHLSTTSPSITPHDSDNLSLSLSTPYEDVSIHSSTISNSANHTKDCIQHNISNPSINEEKSLKPSASSTCLNSQTYRSRSNPIITPSSLMNLPDQSHCKRLKLQNKSHYETKTGLKSKKNVTICESPIALKESTDLKNGIF